VLDRRISYTLNYLAHVQDALHNDSTFTVTGPVAAAQSFIREPVTGAFAEALFAGGQYLGARLLRSHEAPWANGNTVRTIASAIRIGQVLYAGEPGEGYQAIAEGIRQATNAKLVVPLGLANDQLGYLIAPISYVPVITAEVAVNDNPLFNPSPTIGDHVMCTDIRLALDALKFGSTSVGGGQPAQCAPYDAEDATGDPLGQLPVGGLVLP
jgi:hypothetical protein